MAQIIGPALAITGLGVLLDPERFKKMHSEFKVESMNILVLSVVAIVAGTALISQHFLWSTFPEILVSTVGIGLLIKGAFLAVTPNTFKKVVQSMLSNKTTLTTLIKFGGILWLIGGLYLTITGFGIM